MRDITQEGYLNISTTGEKLQLAQFDEYLLVEINSDIGGALLGNTAFHAR